MEKYMTEKMYELAMKLRKTDFFEKLYPTQMFLVEADDDVPLYVNVSSNQNPICLSIYVGNEGFHSFMNLMDFDERKYRFTIHDNEAAMSISSLQVMFESEDRVTDEDRAMAEKYMKEIPSDTDREDSFPVFLKAAPYRAPVYITNPSDIGYVCQVLSACLDICGERGDRFISTFPDITGYDSKVPVVRMMQDGYMIFGKVPVPERPKKKRFRTAKRLDEAKLTALKNSQPAGEFECDVVLYPIAVPDEENGGAYYPFVLMSVDSVSGGMLDLKPVRDLEKDANRLVNFLIDDLRDSKVKPLSLTVRNERTRELLRYFAKKTKTPILMREELPALDRQVNELFGQYLGGYDDVDFYTDEFIQGIEDFAVRLEGMFSDDIKENVSEELRQTLLSAARQGVLSDSATRTIKAKLNAGHDHE